MARTGTIVKGTAAIVGAAAVTSLALLVWRRWDLPARKGEPKAPPAVPPRRPGEGRTR